MHVATQNIVLSNWSNGVVMIAVFGLVCLILILILVKFIISGSEKKDEESK